MLTAQRRKAKLQRWCWQITAVPSALFISPLSFLLPASISLALVNCTVDKRRIVKSRYKSSHSADLLACPPTRIRGSQGRGTATSPQRRLRVVLKTTWQLHDDSVSRFSLWNLRTKDSKEGRRKRLSWKTGDIQYVGYQIRWWRCCLYALIPILWLY